MTITRNYVTMMAIVAAMTTAMFAQEAATEKTTAPAQNAITPGELVIEPPTLICLGFQWFGKGDDNRNATVELSSRASGAETWKRAMPLLRLNPRLSSAVSDLPLFAGSILDLEQDTEYECRLVMNDPDGVTGEDADRIVTARTRQEATIPNGLTAKDVYPAEYQGIKESKGYAGLFNALLGGTMYTSGDSSCWAKSGDILLLHTGVYKGKRYDKRDIRGHPFL